MIEGKKKSYRRKRRFITWTILSIDSCFLFSGVSSAEASPGVMGASSGMGEPGDVSDKGASSSIGSGMIADGDSESEMRRNWVSRVSNG